MDIIVQGILPEDRMAQGTCSNCGTVVRYALGEGKVTSDQRDGTFVSVSCPTCRKSIYGREIKPTGR